MTRPTATCHDCGKHILPNAKACPYCGSHDPHKAGKRPTGIGLYIVTAVAVLVVVFTMVYLYYFLGARRP